MKPTPLPSLEEQARTKAAIHWEKALHGCRERFADLDAYTGYVVALNKAEADRQAAMAERAARPVQKREAHR